VARAMKFRDIDHATWLERLRFRLIRCLAGRCTVVINLHFGPGVSLDIAKTPEPDIFMADCTWHEIVPPGVNSVQTTEALGRDGTWLRPSQWAEPN
jgi:hypothetical protein